MLDELTSYLRWLSESVDVLVIDASPPDVFAAHAARWNSFALHLPPDPNITVLNGKVRGVLTGLRYAKHEKLVIADDDVRYDEAALKRVVALLEEAHVVRPQNYFESLPWHALWDTGRTLLNRMTGGDWPGTLGVRRSLLLATGGYDGDVLFENLEVVRTVRAAGGVEVVPLDLFVQRLPPDARHFWSQRVRQAYDEQARPWRFAVLLSLLPLALMLILFRRWTTFTVSILAVIGLAELGRRRDGGRMVFPVAASLLAPAWLAERAVCTWFALGTRLFLGGIAYHESVIRRAATPMKELRQRHSNVGMTSVHMEKLHSFTQQSTYNSNNDVFWGKASLHKDN